LEGTGDFRKIALAFASKNHYHGSPNPHSDKPEVETNNRISFDFHIFPLGYDTSMIEAYYRGFEVTAETAENGGRQKVKG
jgi:hypothetical protein